MLELIKSINIEVAGYLAVAMVVLTIIVHGLVILKVIPYTWINGGRSLSYESQKKQSILGIIVLVVMIPFLLNVSSIVSITIVSSITNIILWIVVAFLLISTIMQLLGTTFERYAMSIVVFILLVCVLRIVL